MSLDTVHYSIAESVAYIAAITSFAVSLPPQSKPTDWVNGACKGTVKCVCVHTYPAVCVCVAFHSTISADGGVLSSVLAFPRLC